MVTQIFTKYATDGVTIVDQWHVSGDVAVPTPPGWIDTTASSNIVFVVAKPTTISAIAFLARFTSAEQEAVQMAAASTPAIALGLTMGLAAGQIDLTSAALKTWMAGLVTAAAITAARSTEIMTP